MTPCNFGESPLLRRNISPPSSRLKNEPSKKPLLAGDKRKMMCSSETSSCLRTVRSYNPEETRTLLGHRFENLKLDLHYIAAHTNINLHTSYILSVIMKRGVGLSSSVVCSALHNATTFPRCSAVLVRIYHF
jgi:hypothetical protein